MYIQLSISFVIALLIVLYYAKKNTPMYVLAATITSYAIIAFSLSLLISDIH